MAGATDVVVAVTIPHPITITVTITTHTTMVREMAGAPTPMVQELLTEEIQETLEKNMRMHWQSVPDPGRAWATPPSVIVEDASLPMDLHPEKLTRPVANQMLVHVRTHRHRTPECPGSHQMVKKRHLLQDIHRPDKSPVYRGKRLPEGNLPPLQGKLLQPSASQNQAVMPVQHKTLNVTHKTHLHPENQIVQFVQNNATVSLRHMKHRNAAHLLHRDTRHLLHSSPGQLPAGRQARVQLHVRHQA